MCSSYDKTVSNTDNSEYINLIYEDMPDSVSKMLEGRPLLYFSIGHYGYRWSILTKEGKNFRTLSGRVSYIGEKYITEPVESIRFDTAELFDANRALILWGLDTLPMEVRRMRSIERGRENYITIYDKFLVFDSRGRRLFDSNGALAFSGPDSLEFNSKYHRLCFMMQWLSTPELRKYVPESAISK